MERQEKNGMTPFQKDGNAALEVAVEAEAEAEAERLCCTRHGNATTGKSRLAIGGVGQR